VSRHFDRETGLKSELLIEDASDGRWI